MSDNHCDKPNITPGKNTAKGIRRRGSNKQLPGGTEAAQQQAVSGGVVKQVKGSKQQKAQPKTNTGSGGGGGGGGGGGNKKWSQPKTEHGNKKGKKITEKDPCKGEEKKSEEFKPVTIYPFNKVIQTESGHVTETDDTPGSERVSFFHRSGSNYEYHPNGDVIHQHVRDSYFHVFRDQYVHLGGYSSITVDKGLKILVNDDEEQNSDTENVNFDIHVSGNANVNIFVHKGNMNVSLVEGDVNMRVSKGDVNIRQDKGNYNHTVGGDYNLEVAGHMHVVVGGNVVNEIGGNRDERIDGEFDQKYLTNASGYLGEYIAGNKRSYVGGNQITEVSKNINETCTNKVQKSTTKETHVTKSYTIKSDSDLQLSAKNNVYLHSLDKLLLKSAGGMDIFVAEDTTKNGKFTLYAATTAEIVVANYGTMRSVNSTIEIKAPQDIKTITRVLYTPELGEISPRYTPEANPNNTTNPYGYNMQAVQDTESFIRLNKKQWIPTNSKK